MAKETNSKRSWRDVTIEEYFDFVDHFEQIENDYEKEIAKIALATGKSEDYVWNLSIDEFRREQSQCGWMNEFNISQNVKFKTIEIDGEKYNIDTDLQNFTVAQYIDFQTFFPKRKDNPRLIGNILACFIIPKGKKYADGYDIQKLVSEINSKIDILTANEIMFFFLKRFLISTRATANYFNFMMRMMRRKMKDKENFQKLETEWEEMKRLTFLGLRSLKV